MYSPRHARPSCLPARAIVGGSLTALLLPLTMASPVLATELDPVTASAAPTLSPVGSLDPAAPAPVVAPVLEIPAPSAAPAPAPVAKVTTSLILVGNPTRENGQAQVGVRIVAADGSKLAGEWVAIERLNIDGSWAYIGKFQTDANGLAVGFLPFSRDTRIRAGFSATSRVAASVSPEAVVTFVAPVALGHKAVALASLQAGKPYRWGSTGPSSFDCSGLVTYVYKTQLGRSLPRTSSDMARATPRVPQAAKQPGDLIFTHYNGRVGHVGIYAGGGRMWAAPTRGGVVQLQPIYTSSYFVGRVG